MPIPHTTHPALTLTREVTGPRTWQVTVTPDGSTAALRALAILRTLGAPTTPAVLDQLDDPAARVRLATLLAIDLPGDGTWSDPDDPLAEPIAVLNPRLTPPDCETPDCPNLATTYDGESGVDYCDDCWARIEADREDDWQERRRRRFDLDRLRYQ